MFAYFKVAAEMSRLKRDFARADIWETSVRFSRPEAQGQPADPQGSEKRALSGLRVVFGDPSPASLFLFDPRPFSPSWWFWLTLTGVACSCAVG